MLLKNFYSMLFSSQFSPLPILLILVHFSCWEWIIILFLTPIFITLFSRLTLSWAFAAKVCHRVILALIHHGALVVRICTLIVVLHIEVHAFIISISLRKVFIICLLLPSRPWPCSYTLKWFIVNCAFIRLDACFSADQFFALFCLLLLTLIQYALVSILLIVSGDLCAHFLSDEIVWEPKWLVLLGDTCFNKFVKLLELGALGGSMTSPSSPTMDTRSLLSRLSLGL